MVHQAFLAVGLPRRPRRHALTCSTSRRPRRCWRRPGIRTDSRSRLDAPNAYAVQPRSPSRSRTPWPGRHQGLDHPGRARSRSSTKYRARKHQLITAVLGARTILDPHTNADTFARNPDNSDEAKTEASGLAQRLGHSRDQPSETDAAVRERTATSARAMYVDLQRKLQEDAPFVLMFQQIEQTALRSNVEGFVSGPTFDTVFYRLVTKLSRRWLRARHGNAAGPSGRRRGRWRSRLAGLGPASLLSVAAHLLRPARRHLRDRPGGADRPGAGDRRRPCLGRQPTRRRDWSSASTSRSGRSS